VSQVILNHILYVQANHIVICLHFSLLLGSSSIEKLDKLVITEALGITVKKLCNEFGVIALSCEVQAPTSLSVANSTNQALDVVAQAFLFLFQLAELS
jgi:hypothetical protein